MKAQKIKRILIPTDFSETGLLAIEHGAFMAKLFKADLYLLHVIEAIEFTYNVYEPTAMIRNQAESKKIVTARLRDLSSQTEKQYGVKIKTLVTSGRTAPAIAEAAKENKIDVVVMGTHGAKGFGEYFLGSNAHKTVNISPCPVITVQAHAQNLGFTNIVMPIDDGLHSRQKVDNVVELATHYGSRVHLLGLINTVEDTNEKKLGIKLDAVEKVLEKAGLSYVRKVVKGKNLALEAMKYSEKVKSDLMVIMTEHESDMTGMFMGGLARQVVNHSRIPVMSIRPLKGHYSNPDMSASSNPFN